MRELRTSLPKLSDDDRRLARTAVRLLAEGEPLTTERVGDVLGRPESEVEEAIARLNWIDRDDLDRIVGFYGLSLTETAHRLHFAGRELFAWCAMDALYLPLVIGETTRIESRCRTSGDRITLTVSAGGVRELSPTGAVISFLLPGEEGLATGDIRRDIGRLCHNINFFGSAAAAETWTAQHEGTFMVTIAEAFTIAAQFHAPQLFSVRAELR